MESGTTFINIEYIFVKIYDFLVYVKNVVLTGSFSASSGGYSDYAQTFSSIGSWLVTILTIAIILFIIWAIYIRIRIYEIDETLEGSYTGHFKSPEVHLEKVNTRWQGILAHFASHNVNDWRAAVIDADTMLEELVTSLGYTGSSLGEKMMTIRVNDFPMLNVAWEAHKVRNLVAHAGTAYNLTEQQKELTRKNIEAVFRDAGII